MQLLLLLLFAIYGAFSLLVIDFETKNIWPKILKIPACYIVFILFLLTFMSHVFQNYFGGLWHYAFLAIPFLLALSGTVSELSGKVVCPRSAGGIPMCYISFGICITLVVLKVAEIKIK
jgi:hypothetical protein